MECSLTVRARGKGVRGLAVGTKAGHRVTVLEAAFETIFCPIFQRVIGEINIFVVFLFENVFGESGGRQQIPALVGLDRRFLFRIFDFGYSFAFIPFIVFVIIEKDSVHCPFVIAIEGLLEFFCAIIHFIPLV